MSKTVDVRDYTLELIDRGYASERGVLLAALKKMSPAQIAEMLGEMDGHEFEFHLVPRAIVGSMLEREDRQD